MGTDVPRPRTHPRVIAACALAAAVTAVLATIAARAPGARAQGAAAVIDFIPVEGVVDPPAARFLLRELDAAARGGADLVVVQLNTPGGLDAPVGRIVERILASKVPVVTWVSPSAGRAQSAGAFITLAGHVAVMAPGTTLGPSRPANLASTERGAGTETAERLRSIAELRGRDVDLVDRLAGSSFSAEQAVDGGLVDFAAGAPATLLQKLDGRATVVDGRQVTLSTARYQLRFHKMGVMERLLHTAIRPEIAYFLLLLGLFGLIFEVYNPGVGAAGLTGGICLAFSFYALSVLPTSWGGVALLVIAVGFLLVEMHEAGLGFFTVAGLVVLVLGSLMLFSGAAPVLRLPWIAVAVAVAATLLFFISVMTAAIRSRASVPAAGSGGMTGMIGEARTDIAPEGQVFANGTLWKARTAGMAIPEGAKVEILGVSGLLLIVEPAKAATAPE
jgi:membrane-bound serine protease (ClpP class)